MLFPKRQDFSPSQTITLGSTLQFELTREFHIEHVFVECTFTVSGATATAASADNITGIVKRVQVTVSDGAQNRNVVDCSGMGLLEWELNTVGGLDVDTATNFKVEKDSGTITLRYPVRFAHPQLEDPIGSVLLLPAPRFNSNPVVAVTFATQAEIDSNATPTFAISSATCRLIICRRQVTRANFPTFNTELAEYSTTYPTSGNAQLYELQIPGSYTGIMFRDYQGNTTRAFIETTGGENRLQMLGTVIRRFRMADLDQENARSIRLYPATWNNLAGCAYLDFLADKTGAVAGDLGSVLDANILQASGARVQLLMDITGGTNYRRNIVTHRIFGNLQTLKF